MRSVVKTSSTVTHCPKHADNIRAVPTHTHTHTHTHTQEGKRTEWSEWSCVRIIQKEVGPCAAPGDCNGGCPFKTLDEPKLRALLGRMTCGEK